MARDAEHPLTDKPMVGIGPIRGKRTVPLCLCKRGTMPPVDPMQGPQLPHSTQLVLGIVKLLCKLQCFCPSRVQLAQNAAGVCQASSKCCVELHLAPRLAVHSGRNSGK